MRTWFITGGTPGSFGMAYAEAALERGDAVALTVRRPEELAEWAAEHHGRALVLRLDVTNPDQVRQAVAAAQQRFGAIDVLVNNAGRGWFGSVEGMKDDGVRATMDLNFFAVIDVLRAVLPQMRERRSGWIINMSSAAGLRAVPGFGLYSAAKYAVEGLTEALRHEVAPHGLQVMLVEPGAFRTGAYSSFAREEIEETVDAYVPLVDSVRQAMIDADGRQPGDPVRGVREVLKAMAREHPPARLVLGADSHATVVQHMADTLEEIRADAGAAEAADFPSR